MNKSVLFLVLLSLLSIILILAIFVLSHDEAYELGRRVAKNNLPVTTNPYKSECFSKSFLEGYLDYIEKNDK